MAEHQQARAATTLLDAVAALCDADIVDVAPGTGTFAPPPPHTTTNGGNAAAAVTAAAADDDDGVSNLLPPLLSRVKACPDGAEILALSRPHRLTPAARARVFALTFPYTGRAFAAAHLVDGDLATMSEENRRDHMDHTFGGDGVVFLMGRLDAATGAPRLFSHANVSFARAPSDAADPGSTHNSNNKFAASSTPPALPRPPAAVLYVHALCSDPDLQGRGYSRSVLTEAVRVLRPGARYLTLRTMNLAVVKIVKDALAAGSRVAPAAAAAAAADETPVPEPAVFPVDPFDQLERPDLVRVARGLAAEFGWGGTLDTSRLVIPGAYPDFLIPVFKGKPLPPGGGSARTRALAQRVNALIDRDRGDALLCICDL